MTSEVKRPWKIEKSKDTSNMANLKPIQMVDLKSQYHQLKTEIDSAIQACLNSSQFIGGNVVRDFENHLAAHLNVSHVVACANGTDALQIALMALELHPGDEVIVPAFTYVATAEVIALLGLKPIMVDVDPDTFNITAQVFEAAITPKTKAVVPVHLFGQSCDIEAIMAVAESHNIFVIEDNAQAIGSKIKLESGHWVSSGALGHITTTSFYPSKNLGAYGDGGALYTNNKSFADKIRKIANHGQSRRYYHDIIGCNSRLDSIQAAILNIKLKHLDSFEKSRQKAAQFYDEAFSSISQVVTPLRSKKSTHVFHQYTLKVPKEKRDSLQSYLKEKGIPSMIYYPLPLNKQEAFKPFVRDDLTFPITEALCDQVISLPIHTELTNDQLRHISNSVISFFE